MANLTSILGSVVTPLAPFAKVGADYYGAKQAEKASEKSAKREYNLEMARLSQATPADVKAAFLSPPVAIMGAVLLCLAVYLIAKK